MTNCDPSRNPASKFDGIRTQKRAVVAVSTYSHLDICLTMLSSIGAHNPEICLICCLADSSSANLSVSVNDGTEVLLVGTKLFASPRLTISANYFDTLEFCCAAKASALRYALVALGFDEVFYIDSDCFCFGSLADAFKQLEQTTILLTPHFLADGRNLAADSDCFGLVQVGFLNAGTIGVINNPDALVILDWLDDKTTRYGFNCVDACVFLDQTWVSLLPLNFPDHVMIARLPGFNVGPWFLQHRTLTQGNGEVRVDDTPLSLFHFTGFELDRAENLTKFPYGPLAPDASKIVKFLQLEYATQLRALKAPENAGIPDSRLPRRDLHEKVSLYHSTHGDSYFYQTFRTVANRRVRRKSPGEVLLRALGKAKLGVSRILDAVLS